MCYKNVNQKQQLSTFQFNACAFD